jgi:hypothetical protein
VRHQHGHCWATGCFPTAQVTRASRWSGSACGRGCSPQPQLQQRPAGARTDTTKSRGAEVAVSLLGRSIGSARSSSLRWCVERRAGFFGIRAVAPSNLFPPFFAETNPVLQPTLRKFPRHVL